MVSTSDEPTRKGQKNRLVCSGSSIIHSCAFCRTLTPSKTNMSPENQWLEDVFFTTFLTFHTNPTEKLVGWKPNLHPPKALVKTSPWVAILGIGHLSWVFLLPPSGKKWRNFMCFSIVPWLGKFIMWIVLGWVMFWSGYFCYYFFATHVFVKQIMHTCVRCLFV